MRSRYILPWGLTLCVLLGAQAATAQVGTYFVETIASPTRVYAAPSLDATVLGTYTDPVIFKSIGVGEDDAGREFEQVEPLPGSGFPWSVGYVLASDVRVTADERPATYGFGVYGLATTSEVGAHTLSGLAFDNPLGSPGNAMTVGIGFMGEYGRYIPAGGAGAVGKVLIDASHVAADQTLDGDRAESIYARFGFGGDLVYRMTSSIDLSVGAALTGGLYTQGYETDFDTLRFRGTFAGGEVSAGLGIGRASVSGIRVRPEVGYRYATRIGDWSASVDGDSDNLNFTGEPFDFSGPFVRVVAGISFGGRKNAQASVPTPPVVDSDPDPFEDDPFEDEGDDGKPFADEPVMAEPVVPEPRVIPPPGSERIRWVQATLEGIGYDCRGVDGRMGSGTRGCIRAYQTDMGLTVTGEPDEATLEALSYEQL
jgi:hypothetical protein